MSSINVPTYQHYWGKARPVEDTEARCHLLPYHSLDVAAVGQVLLEKNAHLRSQLESALDLPTKALVPWITFLLATHDLGKFAESFQQLNSELREHWWGNIQKSSYDLRHDTLGYLLWVDDDTGLEPQYAKQAGFFDADTFTRWHKTLDPWMRAVTGHHGLPPHSPDAIRVVSAYFQARDVEAAKEFVDDLGTLFEPNRPALLALSSDKNWRKRQGPASWLLAGFAVLCDWLGSDASIFKYCDDPGMTLAEYWHDYALPLANQAVDEAGIIPAKTALVRGFSALFPKIATPTPLQIQCAEITLPESPQLFILEDVTGAGKTEAAVMLVHRLMARGLAQGVFVALPTMATANAMYERMAAIYRALYADDQKPSLVLSHSARHLSELFQRSLWSSHTVDSPYSRTDDTASVQCARWLADHRKKALLADVGIGTVDQALLGILPAKHQSLRLLGLANKVLLIDEVHAYDHYMFPLLKTLLRFHAYFGGSAILLSATLPQTMRQELLNAWREGRSEPSSVLESIAYPLLTHGSDHDRPVEIALDTRQEVARRVDVELLHSESAVMATLKDAVDRGQCGCWIRNTVHDAREAYRQLQQMDWVDNDRLSLFHSRFVLADRLAIEQETLVLFGKESGAKERRGRLLIATQVVEQSLDLDFDVMVSDLAPVDLLIQRAGRMHRHVRCADGNKNRSPGSSDERGSPVFHVFSPLPEKDPKADWYKGIFPRANFVYPHTGYLWRTVRLLADHGGWAMPEDARKLIEGVYGDSAETVPEALEQASEEAMGEWMAQSGLASMNALKLKTGYSLENAWDDEAKIPTRLAEDSATVYLAVLRDDRLCPLYDEGRYPWDLSSLNVPIKKIQDVVADAAITARLEALKTAEKLFNEYSLIIPLEPDGDQCWKGEILDGDEQATEWRYDRSLGLVIES